MSVTIVGNVITATGTLNDTQYKLVGTVQASGDDARLDYAPAGPFFAAFETPAFTGCDTPVTFAINVIPTTVSNAGGFGFVFDSAVSASATVEYVTGGSSPSTLGKFTALEGGYAGVTIDAKPEEFSGWHYVEGQFSRTIAGAGFQKYEVSLLINKDAVQRVNDEAIYPAGGFNAGDGSGPWDNYPCAFGVLAENSDFTFWFVRLVLDPAFNRCVWYIERSYSAPSGDFDFHDVLLAPVDPTGALTASVRVEAGGKLRLNVGSDSQVYTPPDNDFGDEPVPDKLRAITQILSAVTPSEDVEDPAERAISFRNAEGTV